MTTPIRGFKLALALEAYGIEPHLGLPARAPPRAPVRLPELIQAA